jgi:hypothetical protein
MFLLPPPTHTDLLGEYSFSGGGGFRTEELVGKESFRFDGAASDYCR